MQQKRLFPGEGIKVFRERIFDPLLHGLEYAHMGTIIANSGENGKVDFQSLVSNRYRISRAGSTKP